MGKIDVKAIAIAIGLTWGLGVFFLGLLSTQGYGTAFVNTLGSVYLGYAPTVPGAVIGGVLAFIDGVIAGAIVAWIYNHLAKGK